MDVYGANYRSTSCFFGPLSDPGRYTETFFGGTVIIARER